MNYFKCSVGGSGKGNTVIVTCAEEFAGQTIVLAKIGKRYTKTCPSTSPYEVRFYGVESGTYTVSATVQGQTYSETVVVQDVSCVLNYGFTWKTWVDTASQLDSTDYASLSEVLADEEAVRELFTEHACVDYMADSTSSNADLETIIENDLCAKWINNRDYALDFLGANTVIKALMDTADKYGYGEWVVVDDTTTPPTYGPKGNVPVMTANNAPYGEASATSVFVSGYEAFRAFDGNPDTYWESNGGSMMGSYVQYNFVNPICVKKAHYMAYKDNNTGNTLHVKFTASKDGGNSWFDLTDEITLSVSSDKQEYDILFNNEEYLTSIRMYQYSAIYSGQYYALVRGVQYYGRELSVSVPTMTSNTAPYGLCFGGTLSAGNQYNPFDGVLGDPVWVSTTINGNYCGYKATNPICVKRFKVTNRTATINRTIQSCKLQGSNDTTNGSDGTWVDIGSYTLEKAIENVCEVSNDAFYLAHRLYIISNYGDQFVEIDSLQFYGLDYSEKEFEVGTTKKWLYDHGVELETLTKMEKGTGTATNDGEVYKCSAGNNSAGIGAILDLTSYSLIRAKINNATDGSSMNMACGANVTNNYSIGYIAVPNTALPNNPSYDISSVNQSAYANVYCPSSNKYIDITEFWLE